MNLDNNFKNDNIHDKEYSITEIFYILKRHLKLVFYIASIIILLSIYYTCITKPIYKSNSLIMINDDQKSMSMLNMSLGQDINYIENEIQVLRSRTTSDLVVKKLLSNKEYRDNLYLFNTRKYNSNLLRKILTFGFLDKFQNYNSLDENSVYDDSLVYIFSDKLRESLSISHKRNTDAIQISVKSFDPNEAQLLTNIIVDIYRKRDLEWITGEMTHLKTFLIKQIEIKEKELSDIENDLKVFQENQKIFGLDDNSKLLLENLRHFESEYNNALAAVNISNEKDKFLKNQLTLDELNLVKNVTNTVNQRLIAIKTQMSLTEQELVSTYSQYGDEHSAVKILKNKLDTLKSRMEIETKKYISQEISVANPILYRQDLMDSVITNRTIKSSLESKAMAYKKIVDSYDIELGKLPEKILKFTRLERTKSIHAETYAFMRKKLEDARIGEASKIGNIRVLDIAIPNQIPISPSYPRNIFTGILFGFLFAILIVGSIEYFDNSIKSIEQIERRGLSILSIIPAIEVQKKKESKKYAFSNKNIEKLQRRLITHEDPKSPISEAYRGLRTSLMYSKIQKKSEVILISSVGPGEGKTTTIANLAITYANLGKKTVLIDSDLRKPVIHNVFKCEKNNGLTSYLSGSKEVSDIISKTKINNLDIITSGITPPNPSELLDSERMNSLLDSLKNDYDMILFDSPPLIAVTDAYILMKYIDQFALVVRVGITERGGLQRILSAMEQTSYKISGIIMNAMTEEHAYGAGYYYNYYQYYYGDSKNT